MIIYTGTTRTIPLISDWETTYVSPAKVAYVSKKIFINDANACVLVIRPHKSDYSGVNVLIHKRLKGGKGCRTDCHLQPAYHPLRYLKIEPMLRVNAHD